MRVAAAVKLSDEQRGQLEKQARARSATVRLAQRSKMILMAAAGLPDLKIAAELGVMRQDRGPLAWSLSAAGVGGHRERCAVSWPQTTDLRQTDTADRRHDHS